MKINRNRILRLSTCIAVGVRMCMWVYVFVKTVVKCLTSSLVISIGY